MFHVMCYRLNVVIYSPWNGYLTSCPWNLLFLTLLCPLHTEGAPDLTPKRVHSVAMSCVCTMSPSSHRKLCRCCSHHFGHSRCNQRCPGCKHNAQYEGHVCVCFFLTTSPIILSSSPCHY
jgi:hypothetical protein